MGLLGGSQLAPMMIHTLDIRKKTFCEAAGKTTHYFEDVLLFKALIKVFTFFLSCMTGEYI
ncbi:hypothetical protein EMIT074MI3_12208 [Bacillus licheniformis]